MTTVSGTPSQIVVQMDGVQGRPGDTSALLSAPLLSPVLTTDTLLVMRGASFYRATVAAVLAASGITPAGSQLNFSNAKNSALLPGVM